MNRLLLCLLLTAVIIALIEAKGGRKRPKMSKEWKERHGMPAAEFRATKRCMKEFRKQAAMRMGRRGVENLSDSIEAGGILYSLEQCEEMLAQYDRRKKRKVRNFQSQPDRKWTFPILYEFEDGLNPDSETGFLNAVQHWQEQTCLRFEEFDSATHGVNPNRITVTSSDSGCYSYVGRMSFIPQQLNIQAPGCVGWPGIPIHELGHAIGFYHEQSRQDRDEYVTYNADNVITEAVNNFAIVNAINSSDCPYDYASIMHYGSKDFTDNCEYVLTPTKDYSLYTLGQRGHLTFLDSKLANIAYCSDSCVGQPPLACENGGYQDPNDCSVCRCPEGFGGTLCTEAASGAAGCTPMSGILSATDDEQAVSSPGFLGGQSYDHTDTCNWIIRADPGCTVSLRFDTSRFGLFCVGSTCRGPACFHYVEVKYETNKMKRGGRWCCHSFADEPFTALDLDAAVESENEELVVHFDATFPRYTTSSTLFASTSERTGFQLYYRQVCPTTTTTETTTTETTTTETTTTETTTTEPTTTETTTTEPTTTETTTTETTTTETTTTEPTTTETTTTETTTTETTTTETTTTETTTTEPTTTETTTTEPTTTETTTTETTTTETTTTETTTTEPTTTTEAETTTTTEAETTTTTEAETTTTEAETTTTTEAETTTTTLQPTTTEDRRYPIVVCNRPIPMTRCSFPCGGCGTMILRRYCVVHFSATRSISGWLLTRQRCNLYPCLGRGRGSRVIRRSFRCRSRRCRMMTNRIRIPNCLSRD